MTVITNFVPSNVCGKCNLPLRGLCVSYVVYYVLSYKVEVFINTMIRLRLLVAAKLTE